MNPREANEYGLKVAKRLGADEAIMFSVLAHERMVRFANSSLTVTKSVNESGLMAYLTKGGRRIIGSSSNPERDGLERFIRLLYKSMLDLPHDPQYVPLPSSARSFKPKARDFDRSLDEQAGTVLPASAHEAIGAALEAGAERAAGSVEAVVSSHDILTSTGTAGSDTSSKIMLNIRAFNGKEASGHGLSCAASIGGFRPEWAGGTAGEHAKRMTRAIQPKGEGEYQLLMSPTVAANLISLVGEFASAFSVEAGLSYLTEKLGKRVASESLTLTDHGRSDGCLDGRTFDDEGQPTRSTTIVEKGVLRNYLHNISTAKRFGAKPTGNAGVIDPSPWNLEVVPGDSDYDEMVREMKHGLIVTSNWYTRFTNYRTGEFSTVPRDGAYLVEGGEVKNPVKGLRVSDTLERMFSSILLLSKERHWIQWWEVDTPTNCPWVLVDGVKITRAYGESATQSEE